MFCQNCGKEQKHNGRFCEFCGNQLVIPPAYAQPPVQPAPPVTPVIPEAPVYEAPIAPVIPEAPVYEAPVAPVIPEAPVYEAPIAPVIPEAPVYEAPIAPVEPAYAQTYTQPVSPPPPKPKKAKKEKKPRKEKKSRGGLIALLVILGVVIALAVTAALLLFPLEVSYTGPAQTKTTEGYLEDVEITIKANQPITQVKYALAPQNPNDPATFIDGKVSGSMFSKVLKLEELQIPAGKWDLYVYVKTWFGQHTYRVSVECDIGFVTAPTPDQIVEVEDGISLVYNELLVVFADGVTNKEAKALLESYDGEIVGQLYILNQYQVRFPVYDVDELEEIKQQLSQEESVKLVSFNMVQESAPAFFPNDKEYDDWSNETTGGNNWGLETIEAPGAWEYRDRQSAVKVGVLDSFLDYDHPDLQVDPNKVHVQATDEFSTMKAMHQYFEENNDSHECPPDSQGCNYCDVRDHGTHVAGIIGAKGNNQLGVTGVNMAADLHFVNGWNYYTYDGELVSYSSDAGMNYGITYLVMSGCRVVNMSLGSSYPSSPSEEETEAAVLFDMLMEKLENMGYDFLICKAAGNAGADASNYYRNRIMTTGEHARAHVIIVAALADPGYETQRTETVYSMAFYSNYGDLVDIAAPGSNIYSTVFDSYDYMSGTSMATPMVTGTASLLYSLNPELSYTEVKAILLSQYDLTTAKGGIQYSILNARMAAEYVLEEGDGTPQQQLPAAGFLTGLVQDAETEEIVEHAKVEITDAQTGEVLNASMEKGTYYIVLTPGTYHIKVTAEDYMMETIYNVTVTEGVVTYNVLLNMVEDSQLDGTATGRVVDAFDAESIPNAQLKIFAGVNNTSGTPVTTLVSDRWGEYAVTLAPGNYTIQASAEGYSTGTANLVILPGQTRDDQDCTLTPVLEEGELRVVLTWGKYPADLDSHLVGPTPDGGKFHIYWSVMRYRYSGTTYDNLDVDDTNSYGPETTSVYVPVDGTYTFYVHDYSNRRASSSTEMATSGAQVKVYVGGTDQVYVFNAPTEAGTLWKVFSVTDGVLTPINEMSYESSPKNVGSN